MQILRSNPKILKFFYLRPSFDLVSLFTGHCRDDVYQGRRGNMIQSLQYHRFLGTLQFEKIYICLVMLFSRSEMSLNLTRDPKRSLWHHLLCKNGHQKYSVSVKLPILKGNFPSRKEFQAHEKMFLAYKLSGYLWRRHGILESHFLSRKEFQAPMITYSKLLGEVLTKGKKIYNGKD